MAMTKKHYQLVADAVAAAHRRHPDNPAVEDIAKELSARFKEENPSFHPLRFLNACFGKAGR